MRTSAPISLIAVSAVLVAQCALGATYQASLLPTGIHQAVPYKSSGGIHVGSADAFGNYEHAVLWDGTSLVDLHPAGFDLSEAQDVSGDQQAGYAGIVTPWDWEARAMLWRGTAESAVNLHPDGYEGSIANAISGQIQVGASFGSVKSHALMWRGTAESVVDLHPAGYYTSYGTSAAGEWQAGFGLHSSNHTHALLWHGTPDSVVDLHPGGYRHTEVYGMSESSQVGVGSAFVPANEKHALLWHGTASSVVDLHPAGYMQSGAYDTFGEVQVGEATKDGTNFHAMAWYGSAASMINLHETLQGLGRNFRSSHAYGISENGDIVGSAYDGLRTYAIKWTLVPEPASIAFLVLAIPALIAANRLSRRK